MVAGRANSVALRGAAKGLRGGGQAKTQDDLMPNSIVLTAETPKRVRHKRVQAGRPAKASTTVPTPARVLGGDASIIVKAVNIN